MYTRATHLFSSHKEQVLAEMSHSLSIFRVTKMADPDADSSSALVCFWVADEHAFESIVESNEPVGSIIVA